MSRHYIQKELSKWYDILYDGTMQTDYVMDRIYELEQELKVWN